jgi:hypothetical protein
VRIHLAHQEEVETELTTLFEEKRPEVVGNDYMVVGTVEMGVWRRSLAQPLTAAELLAHTSDIEHPMTVHDPRRRWMRADG